MVKKDVLLAEAKELGEAGAERGKEKLEKKYTLSGFEIVVVFGAGVLIGSKIL